MVPESEKNTYRVLWSEEDKEFIGLCAEFPSLSWLASTSEKALKGICSVVKDCISDMRKGKKSCLYLYLHANIAVSSRYLFCLKYRHLAMEAAEAGVNLNRIASAKLAN